MRASHLGTPLLALVFAALGGCYPDFVFDGAGGGGGQATSSATTDPTTSGSTASATTGGQTSTTSATTSSASTSSSSSTGGGPGPPCSVAAQTCNYGEACCYDNFGTNDSCHTKGTNGFGCGVSYTTLECNTDASCPSGRVCCARHALGTFIGTACQSSCIGALGDAAACDPTSTMKCSSCKALLGTTPPYAQYGEC